jgi:hypothetical protein
MDGKSFIEVFEAVQQSARIAWTAFFVGVFLCLVAVPVAWFFLGTVHLEILSLGGALLIVGVMARVQISRKEKRFRKEIACQKLLDKLAAIKDPLERMEYIRRRLEEGDKKGDAKAVRFNETLYALANGGYLGGITFMLVADGSYKVFWDGKGIEVLDTVFSKDKLSPDAERKKHYGYINEYLAEKRRQGRM